MDLKKEIKLSDLFGRRPKVRQDAPAPATPADVEPRRGSFLKRNLRLSVRRRANDSDFDTAAPERAQEPKPRREKKARRTAAPQLPQIPLMRAFNLMPTDDGRSGGARRRPKPAQLVLGVVALVLVAALGSLFLLTNARVADKQREHDDLREQLAARQLPVEAPSAAADDAALVQERDGRRAALSTALGSRVAWDRILRELSLVLPDDVWLTGLTGMSSGGTSDPAAPPDPNAPGGETSVEIKGYARRHEGVALLLSRLAVLPEVEAASLTSSTAVVVAGESLVDFVVKVSVKTGAGGSA